MEKYFLNFTIILLLWFPETLLSQSTYEMKDQDYSEHRIQELANKLLSNTINNKAEKEAYNAELIHILEDELIKDGAFHYPFYQVKGIGIYTSPDSMIRLFNWAIAHVDGSYTYETFVIRNNSPYKNDVIHLKAIDVDSIDLEEFIGDENHWPSALYYDLIEKEAYDTKYYILLAWDGNDRLVHKKWIEVFWFDEDEELKIGAPIFKKGNLADLHRVVFRYSAENKLGLSYREDLDRIEFDHLVPERPSLEGIYSYYGSDLSYDSFYWKTNFWEFVPDIDVDEGVKKRKSDFRVKESVIREKKPIYQH